MGSGWRLATRLRDQGARFEIVGSTASGAEDPADLDVLVGQHDDDLARLVEAVAKVGGWSLLSGSLPSPELLRWAGSWHFGTPDGPLDAFVRRSTE